MSRRARRGRRPGIAAAAALAVATLGMLAPSPARAQAMGKKSQLVVDQLSGFRVGADASLHYYGPIGFGVRSVTERIPDPTADVEVTSHESTFWLAPSADFFLLDHFSVGGLIEFATSSVSQDSSTNGRTASITLPTETAFTFMPRAGWMFTFGEKLALWPRLGLGWASRQSSFQSGNAIIRDTLSGFAFDLDVALLYKLVDGWFIKVAPELSFLPGGSHAQDANNTSRSADATIFQFAGVAGLGVYLDL